MADPVSSQQNSDQSAHNMSSSSSNQYIYSFSDASASIQSPSLHDSVNAVTPSSSHRQIVETDEDQQLKEQLHNLRQESSQQTQKYERAIRRALLENEYVRKINVKLIAKLQYLEEEEDNVKSSLQMLDAVVHQSKQCMREMEVTKQNAMGRCRDLEGRNRQLFTELNITSNEVQRQKLKMETMQSTSVERDARMKQMEIASQKQDEMVAFLRDSLETSSQSYNKLRINLNTVLGERENARFEVERLQIEKDDDLLRRIDAEAHMAKSKREIEELRKRLRTFEETKHDATLDGEEGDLNSSVTKIEESWDEKLEMVKAAMEQATSDQAEVDEVKFAPAKALSRDPGSDEDTERATMLRHFVTGMDRASSECEQNDDDPIQATSKANELYAENVDLRKQVTMLKEGLQDFEKIRDAIADISAERDMLFLKLESASKCRSADNHTMEEKQDELVASHEEVEELRGALTMATEKLQKSDAEKSSLLSQLVSVAGERDELNAYLIHLNKNLLDPTNCTSTYDGGESEIYQSESSQNVYMNIKSKFQSMQSAIQCLQDSLNGEKKKVEELHAHMADVEMSTQEKMRMLNALLDEKQRQISSLQSENRVLSQTKHQIMSEMEERSAKHDHVQLQLDQASEFLEELRVQLSSRSTILDDELTRQKEEREELDAIVVSLKADKEKALTLASELEDQIRESKKSSSQLQEQVELLQVGRVLLLEQKSELIKELQNASEKTNFMRQSLKEVENSNKSIREQLSTSKRKVDEHIALEFKRAQENNLLQQQNTELVESLQSKINMLIDSRKFIQQLQKELSDYKIGLATVYQNIKSQNIEIELLRKQVSEQNEDLKLLRLQKSEADSLLIDREQQLQSFCYDLLPGEHDDSNLTFDELMFLLKSEASNQQLKLEEATDENAILEQQVYILSKQVSECRRENKELLRGAVALPL